VAFQQTIAIFENKGKQRCKLVPRVFCKAEPLSTIRQP